MTNIQSARELLAASYTFSAERIKQALRNGLAIANSRQPNAPPKSLKEVVGICGQGGRHPYFRIPIDGLVNAVDQILDTKPGAYGSSIDRVIEAIAAACQELRQQTYFDAGTGCVNDQLPSMVPLLPPEEVWFNGRELPLDVWRLVSFEFDLLSSGVTSQVPVEDFAFSAVTQAGLAFRFLVGQLGNRRVNFTVEAENLLSPWDLLLPSSLSMDVSLARLFFEAGCLLTPLAAQDFIKWYAAIRYQHWIDDQSRELRVKDEFDRDSVDCRYRGLFAEEMAIGLMALVLGDVFGARPINNTVEVLSLGTPSSKQPVADFVAQTTNPSTLQRTTIIAESKGSLGNLIRRSRKERAKQQVAATRVLFTGSNETLPLTFGSNISFSGQSRKTRCLVADPPIESQSEFIYADPAHAWRLAYAKAFRFVGLETASQQILRGDPAKGIRPVDFDRTQDRERGEREYQRLRRAHVAREMFGMDLLLDVGPCAVSIAPEVLGVLYHGIREGVDEKLTDVLHRRLRFAHKRPPGASFETNLGLGCVYYSDLDRDDFQVRGGES
ncbi:MAG: hypothetical protein HYV26_04045 [Candidatus Hydrogenedentes bacterium]|nr:hypothetical protein [Candidatus Hydrogenedentota bacterium]